MNRHHVGAIVLAATLLFVVAFSASQAYACTAKHYCGAKHSKKYNKAVITKVAKKHHLGRRSIRDLKWLAKRESGYRNWAHNGHCRGLFQIHTHVSPRKWKNPYYNTNRAIHYIKKRYGTTANAVRHSRRYGWY